MMKTYNMRKWLFAIVIFVSSFVGNISHINAQEDTAEFQLDLGIQLDGGDVITQNDYVFEIIERDEQGQAIEDAQVIRYDKTDPNHKEEITLQEGVYTFRLYDGTQPHFTREGKEIRAKLAQKSVVDPQEDQASFQDIPDQGNLNDWGNGTMVYDWNFEVTQEDIQAGEFTLKIVLADEVSLETSDEATNSETSQDDTMGEESTSPEGSQDDSIEEESTNTETIQENTVDEEIETNEDDQNTEDDGTASETSQDLVSSGMVDVPFHVLDNDQSPVEGVVIRVNEETITTDAEGKANITVPAGTLQIAITQVPEGYDGIGAFEPTYVEAGSLQPIDLSVNKLDQTQQVTFSVVDDQGQAVENVAIQLAEQELTTDTTGQVTFEDIPVGEQTYVVSNQPSGFHMEDVQGVINVTDDEEASQNLTMVKEEPTGSIRFMIQNDREEALAGVGMVINNEEYYSDDQGQILIEDLPQKTYDYTFSTIPEGYNTPENGQVTVEADQEFSETLTLDHVVKEGQIRLKVVDQEGNPVANAKVQVDNQTYASNDQGQILIESLAVGEYDYRIESLPEGFQGQAEDVATVEEDQITDLTLSVERQKQPGTLSVQVHDQNNQPVDGVGLLLNEDQELQTDDQGMVTFEDLSEGTYKLEISSVPQGYKHSFEGQDIQISEGQTEKKVLAIDKEVAKRKVSVFIHDQNNQPVENVEMTLADQTLTSDAQGNIHFEDLESGTLEYAVVSVPDTYKGDKTGKVELPEGEDASLDITIEKEIKPASAQVNVTDQNGTPVAGAEVKFGGLTARTDEQGQIVWNQLTPGNYYYQLTKAPEGYKNNNEGSSKTLEEDEDFVLDLQVEKLPDKGTVKVKVIDNEKKPVTNAEIEIAGQKAKTNEQGIVSFDSILKGEQKAKILAIPKDYQQSTQSQTLNVLPGQTVNVEMKVEKAPEPTTTSTTTTEGETSQTETTTTSTSTTEHKTSQTETEADTENTKTEKDSTTSKQESSTKKNIQLDIQQEKLSPKEEQRVSEEAKKATRQFKDPETGIEVWVNPQDAGKADHIVVKKLQPLESLAGLDADAYDISLQDADNQMVTLSKVAEVKIPTRPVNSQLKVIRVDGQDLSSLTFALQNQRTTFRTQKLGTFAVSYGSKGSSQTTSQSQSTSQSSQEVKVSKNSGVDKNNLPGTGERLPWIRYILASTFGCLALYLWLSENRSR